MKKKILVVDDDRMMLAFMSRNLEKDGHQIFFAEDGLSALDILTTLTPDIIFVDLIMPKIDGEKLIRIIRKMPHLGDCFLVVLSGAIGEKEFDYTKINADMYIAKGPFDKMGRHLLDALKEADSPRHTSKSKPAIGFPAQGRRMTRELLSKNRYLEAIIESITEGILILYSGRVICSNRAAETLFALPEEKLLAAYLPDLFDPSVRPRVELMLKSGSDRIFEIGQGNHLELNKRQVIVKSMPVKGDPVTRILLVSDVTERKQLQLQLQHLSKMDAVGTIANGVAHNFRNILAGILTNAEIVQLGLKTESKLHEKIKWIKSSVKRGAQMVDRLLQFSRKQIENQHQTFNLSEVIQETYQILNDTFDKKIIIQVDAPESLPVLGDRSDLSTALMNLCTNARDAMPAGGKLKIEAGIQGDMAVVTVMDTGMGMDSTTVDKCFDPFFTTKEIGKGTGLGLSTTYGIVSNHKGVISVVSTPDKGTVFKVCLPLSNSEFQDEQREDTYSNPIARGNGEKVLVVDDDTDVRRALSRLLENMGYQAEVAVNGYEAVEKYKSCHPDIVLMDINMPGMDGLTCLTKISIIDPDLRAIVISGYEENILNNIDHHKNKFYKAFLVKPFEKHELSASLAQALNPLGHRFT